jgi:CTP synthase
VRRVVEPRAAARVAVVGKYTDYIDSYKSVQESLVHGGIAHDVGVDVDWVSSDRFASAECAREILAGYDGLLVPGGLRRARRRRDGRGHPHRARDGAAVLRHLPRHADGHHRVRAERVRHQRLALERVRARVRERRGLAHGVAAARHRHGWHDAARRVPVSPHAGHARAEAYGADEVSERHRHRYEVANRFRPTFERHGLRLGGLSPDGSLVEMVELADHPWFVGCQFHPELKSRPNRPHPLFAGFVGAAAAHAAARAGANGSAPNAVGPASGVAPNGDAATAGYSPAAGAAGSHAAFAEAR